MVLCLVACADDGGLVPDVASEVEPPRDTTLAVETDVDPRQHISACPTTGALGGCSDCQSARGGLTAAVATIGEGHDACAVDSDCTLLAGGLTCADTCGLAVAVDARDAAEVTRAAIESGWCGELNRFCNTRGGSCPERAAVCDAGRCVAVPACETRADGEACDDHDACTRDDHCASGACVGTGLVCDDGNVCTADACHDGACRFAPVELGFGETLACEPDVCSVAGTCDSGVCVDAGVPGWTRMVPRADPLRRVLARVGDDIVLFEPGAAQRFGPLGEIGASVALPTSAMLEDALAHPSGGVLVLTDDTSDPNVGLQLVVTRLDATLTPMATRRIETPDLTILGGQLAVAGEVIAVVIHAKQATVLARLGPDGITRDALTTDDADGFVAPVLASTPGGFVVARARIGGDTFVRFIDPVVGPAVRVAIDDPHALAALDTDVVLAGDRLARVTRGGGIVWQRAVDLAAVFADDGIVGDAPAEQALVRFDGATGEPLDAVPLPPIPRGRLADAVRVTDGVVLLTETDTDLYVRRASAWLDCADCTPAGCAR